MILLAILLVFFILWIGAEISFSKYIENNNAVSALGNIDKHNFAEINLHELENYFTITDDEIPVYIGRTDCGDCENFENRISPYLEDNIFGINTYFTNSDRDGPRSEKMYALFEKYDIVSVPMFVVIKNGVIIKRWDDPAAKVNEIEDYLTTWLQQHP